jgi:hypothetical protein
MCHNQIYVHRSTAVRTAKFLARFGVVRDEFQCSACGYFHLREIEREKCPGLNRSIQPIGVRSSPELHHALEVDVNARAIADFTKPIRDRVAALKSMASGRRGRAVKLS